MTTPLAGTELTEPLVTRPFVALALAELAYFTADGIAILALPLQVTGPLGGTEAGAGLAFAAFAVTALVGRPIAGRLTDTWGRLPLMTVGAATAAVGLALTAYAPSLTVVVALRLLLGLGEAAFFVAAIAAVADLAPPSRIGEAMSYNSLGLYLGLTLGPPLGEQVVSIGGFRAAWLVAAALAAAAILLVRLVGETREPAADSEPGGLVHVPAIAPSLGFLTSIVAMGGFLTFAALHAERSGLPHASLPLMVYGSTVVLGRIAFGRYVDRVPPLSLGAAALATMSLGMLLLTLVPTPAGVLAGSALTAFGIVFSTPAFFSAIFATASPSERGAASGTASVALDLGLAAGPVMVGLVAEQQGIGRGFAACVAVTLAGTAWTMLLARRAVGRPAA
ncbi:MFS transporter [Mumia zhuanghuii]|uniref:MFS transporter n=2 Tax=Mumia TaxID=1546255 RepID=A0ABW1QHG0_9ACTN|nr:MULTISPECIES: MFS transporter [Mumia]KAA1422700.1 MFS transporter [Mumia zhuanghuii]